jgi:hypothetical protein
MDAWAKHNIPGYRSRASDNPTIALSPAKHSATKAVYREWLRENYGKPVGVSPNWGEMSYSEAVRLSEKMFDAAEVPLSARREYYKAFRKYTGMD